MPPYVTVNQDDVEDFYRDVESHLSSDGLISWAVLIDCAHPLEFYYNREFALECIHNRYEDSGKKLKDKYGLERYQLWRKKS
jgi:hypothetical protein